MPMSTRTLALSMICTRIFAPPRLEVKLVRADGARVRGVAGDAARGVAGDCPLVAIGVEAPDGQHVVLRLLQHEQGIAADARIPVKDALGELGQMGVGLRGDPLRVQHDDVVPAALHLEEIDLHLV